MAARNKTGLESIYHPEGSGIRIRQIVNTTNGRAYDGSYQVDVPRNLTGGRRLRIQRSSLEEAKREAEKHYQGAKVMGHSFFALRNEDRAEIHDWLPKLKAAGISFAQAAEFALTHLEDANARITVGDFIEKYIEAKRQRFERGDLRPRSFSDFRIRAEKFSEAFEDKPIVWVTADEIKKWLLGLKVSPRTTKNYIAVIGEIFNEAISSGILARSPLARISRHERKVLLGREEGYDETEPPILSIDEVKVLLKAAHAMPQVNLFPFVVLALFCGLRSEEIKRLDWSDIHLDADEPSVTISNAIAKKRRIRHVDIPANAVALLKPYSKKAGAVAEDRYSGDHARRFQKVTREAGFGYWENESDPERKRWVTTWKNNAMRHSFGSYHYALHGDAMLTSRLMGHKSNDTVLFDHYRALASKKDAALYFKLITKGLK